MSFGEQKSLFTEKSDHELFANLSLERPLVVFDLETTGLDMKNDRIVQFAFLRVNPDKSKDEWMELVKPGIRIPPESSRVHNITDDMVKDKPTMAHFAPKITEFLQNCDLCGFNIARFDVPFLQAEMERNNHALDLNDINIIDAQVIFHKQEPRDLSAAYRFYCNQEHEDAHDAMGDVQVTLEIFDAQLQRYKNIPRDIKKLHEFCSPKDDRWVTQDRKFYWRHGKATIGFGKHKGKSLEWIVEKDRDYLMWMKSGDFSADTKEMIINALNGTFPVNNGSNDD